MLHSLEQLGALTRPASKPAGRTMPTLLTRRGKALLKRADAAARVADQRILTRLSADDQRHLKRLLYAAGTDSAR